MPATADGGNEGTPRMESSRLDSRRRKVKIMIAIVIRIERRSIRKLVDYRLEIIEFGSPRTRTVTGIYAE